ASFSGINNLIVVGATNSDGNAPYFTNWGSSVDIAAPGDNILSTYSPLVELMKKYQQNPSEEPDLDNMEDAEIYKYLGGTSMAAPYVTGACALLLSKYPDATPSEIKNALLEGANRNINPTVHPFASFDEQLKTVADEAGVPYEDVKDVTPDTTVEELRELLYEKYFSNDPFSFLAFFTAFGKIKASVEAYKILDGKGKVSRTGLLDLKAALDVLAKDSGGNFGSSSGGGCNTGLEGVFASLAAGIAIILMKKHKN
ncbi:MAG: S8 family serine peptidase, partial [Synergistaceae bacterium]|nr:S8 family serine peptidase [Synergistaceae bacterium]